MKGRCTGCDFEDTLRRVESHHRGCEGFAQLYQRDPALALVNPIDVYAMHHLASEPAPEAPKPEPVPKRRVSRSSQRPAPTPTTRPQGPVHVEYWSWQLSMLEELQAASKS
jgi:cell division septation protein DedD